MSDYGYGPSDDKGGSGSSSSSGDSGLAASPPPTGGNIQFDIPLLPQEIKARKHALLCSIGFLVLLPLGVLVARYTRTWNRFWFWNHATIQLLASGPVIFYGWALGQQLASDFDLEDLHDPHQKIGIALLAVYVTQLAIGVFIHFVKFPKIFPGGLMRNPLNYIHALLGLAILGLAAYQVHYGLYIEWIFFTGGLHKVPDSAKHAWLALIIVFWVLYTLGLAFLPKQFKQETKKPAPPMEKEVA
ncbi:Cytochrome b561 domain-containing protein [Mycena kentingensis (nom. inval.)]|nr:Cytochrome b561 domain-containing protein [Mycena kentingensis (nom. inval.)]